MRWLALIIALVFCLILGLAMWRAKKFRQKNLEPIFMWIMLFGIAALCQPLWQPLYQYGFPILLTGTAGYVFVTHLK
ncbi:MAG: hypothetical protein FJW66_01015 [Actinobacteria bacterium]|nr:hypothetical protein [Actinomycetota bacterium]